MEPANTYVFDSNLMLRQSNGCREPKGGGSLAAAQFRGSSTCFLSFLKTFGHLQTRHGSMDACTGESLTGAKHNPRAVCIKGYAFVLEIATGREKKLRACYLTFPASISSWVTMYFPVHSACPPASRFSPESKSGSQDKSSTWKC